MVGIESVPHAPAPAPGNAGIALAQFFIPAATSLQERRPRTLKHGDTFAVFDHNGDALAGPGSPEGIYHRDTRHLSLFYLTVQDARPMLLSSTLRDDNATLTCDLTNPDLFNKAGKLTLAHDLIHIRRSRFLWDAACFERLVIRNFDAASHYIRISFAFSADFSDVFEVRGAQREQRGSLLPARLLPDGVVLSYIGLDRNQRDTRLQFDPLPKEISGEKAVFEFFLRPHESQFIFVQIQCGSASIQDTRRSFSEALRASRRALRVSSSRAASIETSNEIFNEVARRGISDLYMLLTDTSHGPYPYAGIPWFSTIFGRDALITALQTLWLDPAIARGVLSFLAAHQAQDVDSVAESEPGKILHELRHGEMANLGEVPFGRYYGTVDATPLFIMLAGAYLERTNDVETLRRLWPNIKAALEWIDTYGDSDGDGFVEYHRRSIDGLANQGWKDSQDSVFHIDGTLARGPIALAEVQAYVYGAFRAAAEISRRLEDEQSAIRLQGKADVLRQRFDEAFFDEELGTYVLALDGNKRPCRVRTSNAGHALFTGLAYPERAQRIVDTLMTSSFFSGWGVRTVASTEARYNPMSYHNGSVWPHDNALIAAGFSRYGFRHEAIRIFEGLFAASTYIDLRRLPELICGFSRQKSQGPTFFPVACAPQAWAAVTPMSLIRSCLGLHFDGKKSQIVFERPMLPEFLNEVRLRRLSLGDCSADIHAKRMGSEVVVSVVTRRGDVETVTVN
jgi:glycogen debranching enzyme